MLLTILSILSSCGLFILGLAAGFMFFIRYASLDITEKYKDQLRKEIEQESRYNTTT